MKKITVDQLTFELEAGESVLDGLLRTGHPVEYQCKNGYCGACKCRLVSGSVAYPTPPLAYVPDDQVLTCCCHPQTDLVLDLGFSHTANSSTENGLQINKMIAPQKHDTQVQPQAHPTGNKHPEPICAIAQPAQDHISSSVDEDAVPTT